MCFIKETIPNVKAEVRCCITNKMVCEFGIWFTNQLDHWPVKPDGQAMENSMWVGYISDHNNPSSESSLPAAFLSN